MKKIHLLIKKNVKNKAVIRKPKTQTKELKTMIICKTINIYVNITEQKHRIGIHPLNYVHLVRYFAPNVSAVLSATLNYVTLVKWYRIS